MNDFKPNVVIFRCHFCTPVGAGKTLMSEVNSNFNPSIIQTTCTGRIDPTYIMDAFVNGADGVMIAGCPPGDCHFVTGNYKARRNLMLLKKTLGQLGIEPDRIKVEWTPASETKKIVSSINKFVDKLVTLRPLNPN